MPKKNYSKRADGRYAVYRDRKPFYGATIAEAEAKRRQYDLEKMQGLDHEKSGMLVSQYAERWLPVYRGESCEKSYRMYANVLDSFIEFTHDAHMRDIRKTDIVSFYNTLSGYSQTHINKYVHTIHGMFAAAREDGVIMKDPTRDAKAPKGTEGKCAHRPLEDWERDLVHRMLDVEYRARNQLRHGHPFAPAAIVMLYQGLRREEVLALNIDRDVDFENNLLYVREAMSYTTTHRGRIEKTKTEKGTRCMPLFKPVRDVLQGRHGLLVKPVMADQMTDSAFQSVWKSYKYQMGVLHNNGLRPRWDENGEFEPITIRTHDFRHSFCTMICEAGVDIKTAMIWMGHSDEKMIRRIYDHVTQKRLRLAEQNTAKMIDEIISNSQNNSQLALNEPETIEI